MKKHLCKTCGEVDPGKFYDREKGTCKVCRIEEKKQYQKENAEIISKYNKQYRQDNAGSIKEYYKDYYDTNKKTIREKQNEYSKKWRKDNQEYDRAYHREYSRQKKQVDPGFKYLSNLRVRQCRVLKGIISTTEGLGCNTKELRDHLESLFTDGMTHDNYGKGPGKWNIDHIDPISLLETGEDGEPIDSEDNRKLIHYTNMQPLWEKDNLKKSNKVFSKTLDLY